MLRIISSWLLCLLLFSACKAKDNAPMGTSAISTQGVNIHSLMSRMTLEEKVGQLTLFHGDRHSVDWLKKRHTGLILNAMGPQVDQLQEELGKKHRLGVPVLFMIDAVNGHAFYPGATVFPSQLALSSSWNPELIRMVGVVTAKEMKATGIHLTFAPVLEVARDLRWGRVGETFGEDPWLVGELGAARIEGLQTPEEGSTHPRVMACAKHYLGYSQTLGGRDAVETVLSELALRQSFLLPFERAVEAQVGSVMAGYHSVLGEPMSANRYLLKQVLRNELRFQGLVISDYKNLDYMVTKQFVARNIEEAAEKALKAGNDVSMATEGFVDATVRMVKKGRIKERTIDRSCRRVLEAKQSLGLFDKAGSAKPESPRAKPESTLAKPEHTALALEAAYQSLVLLRNRGVLPLSLDTLKKSKKPLVVTGANANDIVAQLGDWSLGFMKKGEPWMREVHDRTKGHVTILQGIRARVASEVEVQYIPKPASPAPGKKIFPDAYYEEKERERKSAVSVPKDRVVIAVVGDNRENAGESRDRADLALDRAQIDWLKQLKEHGNTLIVVLLSSKPLAIPWIADNADALIVTFNSGMKGGEALAGVLFGDRSPQGRLTVTFPHHGGQNPAHYDQAPGWHGEGHYADLHPKTKEPLFAFGEGLSYTKFCYSKISVPKKPSSTSLQNSPQNNLHVKLRVENCGTRSGTEVVQLYLRDVVSSLMQPKRRLLAYEAVRLQAGESRTVVFQVPAKRLAIWNRSLKRVIEAGSFEVFAGSSSRVKDLPLRARFRVEK